MAVSMSPKPKVYQDVLKEIRKYIDAHRLKPGDKLPSERELSERLKAGRSSVREALRAMELLGLIETRHGEGTYLSTYRPYQTIELLASFILQENNNTKRELTMTKTIIEKEAVKLAFHALSEMDIKALKSIAADTNIGADQRHLAFFNYIFDKSGNLLLAKIWLLMEEFSLTVQKSYYQTDFYDQLIAIYEDNNYKEIEELYRVSFAS